RLAQREDGPQDEPERRPARVRDRRLTTHPPGAGEREDEQRELQPGEQRIPSSKLSDARRSWPRAADGLDTNELVEPLSPHSNAICRHPGRLAAADSVAALRRRRRATDRAAQPGR